FPVPECIVFHTLDLKTGAPSENGVTAAFRRSDDLAAQQLATAVRLRIPIDTATGQRATVDTPADRIQIIEVTPEEAMEYVPAGAGYPWGSSAWRATTPPPPWPG